ncbi:MAG: carboxypeptidase-like regulatory domain-containing protein [Blastocatellia bacterium]
MKAVNHFRSKKIIVILFSLTTLLVYGAFSQNRVSPSLEISGTVISENGGIPAAVVSAFVPGSQRADDNHSVTTDLEGKFKITGLRNSWYQISASAPGFISQISLDTGTRLYLPGEECIIRMEKGGVITGRITAQHLPVVALPVTVQMVRDINDHAVPAPEIPATFQTDDRGIYRIYGLPPGKYRIVANPSRNNYSLPVSFDGSVPVFYPSVIRPDAAQLVTVFGGQIVSGIDIDLGPRARQGRSIYGLIENQSGPDRGIVRLRVELREPDKDSILYIIEQSPDQQRFFISGLQDGVYELRATAESASHIVAASPLMKVLVGSADVRNIVLTLKPFGRISGEVAYEKDGPACSENSSVRPDKILLALAGDPKGHYRVSIQNETKFELNGLVPGNYHPEWKIANDSWFVKQIDIVPGDNMAHLLTDQLAVEMGTIIRKFRVTLAKGASTLTGVVPESDRQKPGRLWLVIAVPQEEMKINHPWLYLQALSNEKGEFHFNALAPGKYKVVFQPAKSGDPSINFWDARNRTRLLKMSGVSVTLLPCQKVNTVSDAKPPAAR